MTIEIQGLDRAMRKLTALKNREYVEGTMQASVSIAKNYIAVYPASTEANNPARNRWYERGYGGRWRRRDGTIGGRRTSETLGRKWTTKVEDRGMTGKVGNNVSYGPYVQSHRLQAGFHRRRGWTTDEQAAKRQTPSIQALFRDAIERAAR